VHQSEEISLPEPTLSRELAEETLLIAARLQHEHRELLTLSELKQTAAEVDISPEFVELALHPMDDNKLHSTASN
jgi:hypothetical protein